MHPFTALTRTALLGLGLLLIGLWLPLGMVSASCTQPCPQAMLNHLKARPPRQTSPGLDLRLVKLETVFHPVRPGGVITYFLAYFNEGTITATNVVITEELPLYTQFNPQISSPCWQIVTGTRYYRCDIGAVTAITEANGGFRYFGVTVDQPIPDGVGLITNTATISATEIDINPNNNIANEDIQVENVFDLSLTKTANRQITAPSDTILYTLYLTNTGNKTATNIILQETVPAETTLSDSWGNCAVGAVSGTICNLMITQLEPGQAQAITFTVAVTATVSDTVITNTAMVLDDGTHGADALPADNVAQKVIPIQSVIPQIDLGISKSDGGQPVQAGDILTYTLLYFNRGEAAVSQVILTETLPANVSFIGPTGWQAVGNGQYRYDAGALATGPTAFGQVNWIVQVNSPLSSSVTMLTNTAMIGTADGQSVDINLANNEATITTPITVTLPLTGGPNLRLLKLADETVAQAGSRLTYGLIYANVGNRQAEGVVLTELLPPNTTFVSGSIGWQQIGGSRQYVYQIGHVPSGYIATEPITLTLLVADPLPISLTQLSNVTLITDNGQNGTEQNQADNLAQLDVAIINTALPDLSLNKTSTLALVTLGDLLTYRLSYANNGGAAAQGVRLTETVPMNTVFRAAASLPTLWSCPDGAKGGTICNYQLPTPLAQGGAVGQAIFAVQVITSPAVTATQIVNQAMMGAANGQDPTPQNNQASAVTSLYVPPVIRHHYLPLLVKNRVNPVDLIVQNVTLSNPKPKTSESIEIKVTLTNRGAQSSLTPFWVDLYLARQPLMPQVNQGWDSAFDDAIVPHGVAWRVYAIAANGSLALSNLRPNDPLDNSKNYSNFIPTGLGQWPQTWKGQPLHASFYQPGTYYLYVLVDSFEDNGLSTGAVAESNETNNLFGPLQIVVSGASVPTEATLDTPHPLTVEPSRPIVQP